METGGTQVTKGTGSENRMQSEQQKQVQCQLGGGAQPSYQSLEFHFSEDSEDGLSKSAGVHLRSLEFG